MLIQNLQKFPVPLIGLRRLARRLLGALDVRTELSVALVDDAQMRALNRRWRRLDRTTDVLSFPQGEAGLLGDVVLSLPESRAVRDRPTERGPGSAASEVCNCR